MASIYQMILLIVPSTLSKNTHTPTIGNILGDEF